MYPLGLTENHGTRVPTNSVHLGTNLKTVNEDGGGLAMADSKTFSKQSLKEERTSKLTVQPLYDDKLQRSLSTLRKIVSSSLGPYGRLKFFQTSPGGHVTVTSTSSRIVHNLTSMSHPIIRLILSAVRGQLDIYSDGGLRTALLTLSLIESSLHIAVPRALITQIIQHALEICMHHMESCQWKMKLDVGNVKSMLSIVNGVIGTKPACHLDQSEKEFISVLLIKAFVQSLPSLGSSSVVVPMPVQILTCEGDSVKESKIVPGILLEAPETPTFQVERSLVGHRLKVALYNVSMAGDTEEWFDSKVKTEVSSKGCNIDLANASLQQMIEVVDWLVSKEVKMVACQKCIHPALKQYLRDKGVFVVDRLSILHISAVQRLTRCTLLSTFSTDISEMSFGYLEGIEHVVIGEKSFIHLHPQMTTDVSSICTLLVCSPSETTLDELKSVCQASISALHELVVRPFVVPGAGCLDTHLAAFLRQYGQNCGSEITSRIGCTRGQFLVVISNVASCLESLANSLEHDGGGHVTDSTNHHHWSLPPGPLQIKPSMHHCMCGLVTCDPQSQWSLMGSCKPCLTHSITSCSQPQNTKVNENNFENSLLDVLSMKMNSYKIAFETAYVILRIHCQVCSDVGNS